MKSFSVLSSRQISVALGMIVLTVLKLKNNSHVTYTNTIEYQALVLCVCQYEALYTPDNL